MAFARSRYDSADYVWVVRGRGSAFARSVIATSRKQSTANAIGVLNVLTVEVSGGRIDIGVL